MESEISQDRLSQFGVGGFLFVWFFFKVTSKMNVPGRKRAQFCNGLGFVVFVVALMPWSWSWH